MPPFRQSARCLSLFQENLFSLHCLDFQAEDRLTPRWHVGQPCGKASWESPVESLVGKPRGKATDPLIQAKGIVTLLLQVERRYPFPAWSGKNSRLSHSNSRGTALHRKGERSFRVVPPCPESPRCLSPFQENLFSLHCLDFQAEDRLTPRWHVGQPCGKAS